MARSIFINRAFPITNFMHSSHNSDLLKPRVKHVLQKAIMVGQIPHMVIRIMFKTITPSHVQTYIRGP